MSNAMFNNKGELNASSLRDALMTITKYASLIEENQPSNAGLSSGLDLSDERRGDLMSRAIYSNEGKLALAQAIKQ